MSVTGLGKVRTCRTRFPDTVQRPSLVPTHSWPCASSCSRPRRHERRLGQRLDDAARFSRLSAEEDPIQTVPSRAASTHCATASPRLRPG